MKVVFINTMSKKCWVVTIIALIGSFAAASIELPLKYRKQEQKLSCEAAALRMVLNFHEVKVSEAEVIAKMPFDRTEKREGIWGDPNLGFVGDINGQMGETGYGIHWEALAKLATKWKKAEVLDNANLQDLVRHLDARRPVIIWMVEGGEQKEISWKTKEGKKIFALDNEHTQVVYGYKGDPSAPSAILVMDPLDGAKVKKTSDFLKEWDSFGRKGVVVYR